MDAWVPIAGLQGKVVDAERSYSVAVEGIERPDGTWAGRLVFLDGKSLRITDEETSQPSRDALVYWASGLEPIYLEGAFQRARATAIA